MDLYLFLASLAMTLAVVIIPLVYLRGVTRRVLLELCHRSGVGAEFWLKVANTLAICGSLMLVLMFGKTSGSWTDAMRITLILALSGVFFTVVLVASSIARRASVVAANHAEKELVDSVSDVARG